MPGMRDLPGRDYKLFFADPLFPQDRDAYHHFLAKRYLFTDKLSVADVTDRMEAVKGVIPGYEIIHDTGGPALHITEDAVRRLPTWTLGQDLAHELRDLAEPGGMVLVRNPLKAFQFAAWTRRSSVVLRELWEVMRENPDTEFIVSGEYEYRLWFLFGASGGAISMRSGMESRGSVTRVIQGDGRMLKTSELGPSSHPSGHLAFAIGATLQAPVTVRELQGSGSSFTFPRERTRAVMLGLGRMNDSDFTGMANGATAWGVDGDRIRCDECSLHHSCTLFEEGSVCALPSSDGRRLSSYFDTRESKTVIDGIGQVLQYQASRLERAIEDEDRAWERQDDLREQDPDALPYTPSPAISRMVNDVQRNGERYAKLIDPNLTRPQMAVQINTGTGKVETPRVAVTPQMIAGAARELEASGVTRGEQTTAMIYKHISDSRGGAVIEGEVIDGIKEDF